ncbi:hypothetical protein [Streptomyces carpaticus]|uniref:Lipoprotein n=1 Tax=Streptomyces carpaticus TaxID=285558 RepID=A0ABV4ZKD0_9ACTN
MTHRTRIMPIAAAAVAVGLPALVGCSSDSEPTQDEIAAKCLPALKERPGGDGSKPAECEGLTDDNYTMLIMSVAMDDLGWFDDDGHLDLPTTAP